MRFSGPALQAARERAGKSREQVAVDIGRSYQSVVSYERYGAEPPATVLLALTRSLDVDVLDLFAEEVPA